MCHCSGYPFLAGAAKHTGDRTRSANDPARAVTQDAFFFGCLLANAFTQDAQHTQTAMHTGLRNTRTNNAPRCHRPQVRSIRVSVPLMPHKVHRCSILMYTSQVRELHIISRSRTLYICARLSSWPGSACVYLESWRAFAAIFCLSACLQRTGITQQKEIPAPIRTRDGAAHHAHGYRDG